MEIQQGSATERQAYGRAVSLRGHFLMFLAGRQKCVDAECHLGAVLIEDRLREQIQGLGGIAGAW
ncbi:hypothetical protein WL70_07130 [Burkholderia ubonensis]|nr:hypothetical protein WL70_07130 [Burkholderia ubonensis]KWD88750.1 hypothetical protein WL72_34205 [Burkholderia ubonensis]